LFAAPLVEVTVLTKAPLPFGQRPYVTPACAVHVYESTRVFAAS
jgi:hypothetical protein